MFNKTIELVGATLTPDGLGQMVETPAYRKVYARLKSVAQSEFFAAGQTDIKPAACFIVRTGEYQGEKKIRYNGAIYSIYRTYDTQNEMTELYCEVRAGG